MPRTPCSALFGLMLCVSCGASHAPSPTAKTTPIGPASGGARAPCPRVARAGRMWTGFLVDVPSEAMVRALDSVVPIQVALGELFCAPERADCRPSELQAIDLTDEHANVAQLRLLLTGSDGGRELALTLQAQNEIWSAQPESLTQYLALCRSERAASNATESTKAAP